MTLSTGDNRCKLLVFDVDTCLLTLKDLRTYFTSFGPVEWIETFPSSFAIVVNFVSYLIVDRLVANRTCSLGEYSFRLRRFRSDPTNWHTDCSTLRVRLPVEACAGYTLNETSLRLCFRDYQSDIVKIDVFAIGHATITFSDYDHVDRILLLSAKNSITFGGVPLVLERGIKIKKRAISRWDQPPSATVLSRRDPVVHQLLTHIGHLSKQLQEQPNHSGREIERLEAQMFVLKNENATLKSQQQLSSNRNLEQRLTTLEDISNRLVGERSRRRRLRSISPEKPTKRRRHRQYANNNDAYSNSDNREND